MRSDSLKILATAEIVLVLGRIEPRELLHRRPLALRRLEGIREVDLDLVVLELRVAALDRRLVLRLALDPEDVEPAEVHLERDPGRGDRQVDLLPRRPRRAVPRAQMEDGRVLLCAADEVVRAGVRVVVAPADAQVRQLCELRHVALVCVGRGVGRDLLLQQVVGEVLEDRRLVVAEIGVDVRLREQEHLPVRLPDAVVLAPLPLVGRNARRVDLDVGDARVERRIRQLEVEQAPLDVELHAVRRAHDA